MKKHSFFSKVMPTLGFALATSVGAQDINFAGSLTSQFGFGLPNAHKNKGDFLLGQTIFDGSIKSFYEESMVYVNAQIVHDALGSQSSNGHSGFVSDDGSIALKLREAYIDWKGGIFALRIGRQIVSWGKADDIQITDIISPKDESGAIATDYNESRLGIDAVRLSILLDQAQFDAYFIPFFTPSILPLSKGNPLRSHLFPDSYDGITINSPKDYTDFERPKNRFSNSEYALRASVYTSIADLSLYGFYGWEDTPFIRYVPTLNDESDEDLDIKDISVTGKYKRTTMIGADAAIPAGDFVFRLEVAFFPRRHFQTTSDFQIRQMMNGGKASSSLLKYQTLSLAGFDWTPSEGWTITAQYISDFVCNHDNDIDRKNYLHQATLSIEKTLLNETLTISASGAMDLRAFSTTSELEIDYKLSDAITLSLIGDLNLEGPNGREGLFGEYRDFSSVTFKGKMSF